jgi:branched-chain amino acid transport system substrate-binding protein
MQRRRRWVTMNAAFLLLAVGVVACGSSDSPAAEPEPTETDESAPETTDTPETAAPVVTEPAVTIAPADTTAPAGAGAAKPTNQTVVLGIDLPLIGASADASSDTNNAIELLLEQAGGRAGDYNVTLQMYDNSTVNAGAWDAATCARNADEHVNNKAEVAVIGAFNSGCSKIEIPIMNQDPTGPMLLFSHANTNPGVTKSWDPGEPDKYYPLGVRNYARLLSTDDLQGKAAAEFAADQLHVTKCVVLNDAQTYGVSVGHMFEQTAAAVGVEIAAVVAWDPGQDNYVDLFKSLQTLNPDCIYLAGLADENGEQLIRDKVQVFGSNSGPVKLLAPDGFTGFPSVQALPEAEGMYISFSGLPMSALVNSSPAAAKFVDDFRARWGHDPASEYSIYGAAVAQFLLKAIAASDGTRRGVLEAAFSGTTVPADESLLGKEIAIDANGDVTVGDVAIQVVEGGAETFVKAWPV